ncbi:hypothetical protein HII31_02037 [Pseudocercospora fuligena]|uniref:Uncharacterized protein n=1 Tax=Pseudocercospora fuligena TaxID=685502 RepID=A0A8H6RST9_9PEZI|nr:hypothetical protein HII31_02037 [Pseudocercospora fuligena]
MCQLSAQVTDMKSQRSLKSLLEALPRELYDLIYDETFTVGPSKTFSTDPINKNEKPTPRQVIIVKKTTKPPSVMQVNRSIRCKVMESYYSNTFVFETPDLCRLWFGCLGTTFLVQKVGFVLDGKYIEQPVINTIFWLVQKEGFCMQGDLYLPAAMECLKSGNGMRAVSLR